MKPFIPYELPLKEEVDQLYFMNVLIEAATNVGIFKTMLNESKIDASFMIHPLLLQEAYQSTKIEGTQTTFDAVLESEIDEKQRNDDTQEVMNYFNALKYGEKALTRLPISTRLFKELHLELLKHGVRGQHRMPGDYRKIQNFIGPSGCTMENATFIPPEPHLVDEYMSNLEQYINEPMDELNPLVRIAIIHAQFETIHPFLDGNGRIGRILIPLYLYDQKVINSANFFISETLEKDKHKYYRLLNGTRTRGEWNEWIRFFLESVNKQAEKNIKLVESINELYEKDLALAMKQISNNNIVKIIDVLFKQPIFTVKVMSALTGISDVTCRRYLKTLEERKIIYGDDHIRNKKYYYYNLLDLLR